ncbi:hypothetical protein TNCV_4026811 [Trichonephila clavipes]|nr:hypothetical protein TNCV_4026811 [Trichonephila clavipes]
MELGEENILYPPDPVVFAVTAHKPFEPTDLTSTYCVCNRKVFGGTGIKPRHSDLESDALTTRIPTACYQI